MQTTLDTFYVGKSDLKTCPKCGETKPFAEYHKNKSVCKECRKLEGKQYREKHPDEIKQRKKQYYTQHKSEISQHQKEYYTQNIEKIKQYHVQYTKQNYDKIKIYREEHKEKIKIYQDKYNKQYRPQHAEQAHEYYLNNINHKKQYNAQYRKQHADRVRLCYKQYHYQHLEERREYCRQYRKTSRGKDSCSKSSSKRRLLGFNPINTVFENSHFHHLWCRGDDGVLDRSIGVHIPKALHKSVFHKGESGYNMEKINTVALKWYLNNTCAEEINPVAINLFKQYNILYTPSPVSI